MYDNIQDRAAAGCFAIHCFLLRYNYIQLPVLETHAAAAWHGTPQTAVNNSEGFMIGDHMYCARHTSGDIWYEGTKSYHFDIVQCNKYDHKSQVTVSPVSQNVVSPCQHGLLSLPPTFRGHICDHLCGNCHLLQIFWPRQEICRKTETCQF